ncbi:hypothetical protein [Bhargavaea massiliensis]|uniref:hypothetical protein n=1 Tax=Bhargavaea massiliensis TaxID=2697500 RepID=UPI001BD00872|nr:hypothetical protein [Bhargavaea massiliensis]
MWLAEGSAGSAVSPFMSLVSAFVTPVSAFAAIFSSLAQAWRSNDEMIWRNDETGPLNDVIKRANDDTGDGTWAVEYLPIYAAFLTESHQMKSGLRTFHHPLHYRGRPVSSFMSLVSSFVTPVSAFTAIVSSLARACMTNNETGLPNDETAPAGEIKKLPDHIRKQKASQEISFH